MKIFKDILNALKIETMYIVSQKTLFLAMPVEINHLHWILTCDSDEINGSGLIKVKYRGSFFYLKAEITKKEQDSFCSFIYEAEIDKAEINKDKFKQSFFSELEAMEKNFENWNRRKEKRYEIGMNVDILGKINFRSAEQTVVADKKQLPCLVNNISYSGAKVTTLEGDFHKDKKICLLFTFSNPIEQIPVVAFVKNCTLKSAADKTIVSILSVKFEDSPYEFRKRLDHFIEQLEK